MLNSFASFYPVLVEEFNGTDLLFHDDDSSRSLDWAYETAGFVQNPGFLQIDLFIRRVGRCERPDTETSTNSLPILKMNNYPERFAFSKHVVPGLSYRVHEMLGNGSPGRESEKKERPTRGTPTIITATESEYRIK